MEGSLQLGKPPQTGKGNQMNTWLLQHITLFEPITAKQIWADAVTSRKNNIELPTDSPTTEIELHDQLCELSSAGLARRENSEWSFIPQPAKKERTLF